jgi:regulation of enolase protein 1 (concanavalin A-like superfamily)
MRHRARPARIANGKPRSRAPLAIERLDARVLLCAEHLAALAAGGVFSADDLFGDVSAGAAVGSTDKTAVGVDAVPVGPEGLPPVAVGPAPILPLNLPAGAPPPTAANGLPLLASRPEAPVAVYLDLDGYTGNGYGGQQTHAPYSIDADSTTYNAAEQANIVEAWTRISAHFAPFDVNVTTIVPTIPRTWTIITPSFTGAGYSYSQFNGFAPSSFNPQGDLLGRTSGVLHEIGHDFGLAHQSDYDLLGNKTKEYRNATDSLHAPIMGVDYDGSVPKWYIGHPSGSPSSLQDDVARIAAKIAPYQGAGGDGFRPDDFGNTIATAATLSSVEGIQFTDGIIERLSDVDLFAFTSTGGVVSLAATRRSLSGVDLKLQVYAADGTLLANSDTTPTDQRLSIALPAGTYYAAVSGHGDYGDIGPYNFSVQALPGGWQHSDVGAAGVAGHQSYNPATDTYTVAGSGGAIGGTVDAFHYAYQRLTGDGEIIARVASIENTNESAKAGVMIRESLAAGSKQAMMIASYASGTWLRSRAATNGSSADSPRVDEAFAPVWLRLVRAGNTLRAYSSANGVDWTLEGTATVSMTSTVYIGLATTATNNNALNHATFDHVSITGALGEPGPTLNALAAPSGFAVTGTTGAGVSLSWTDGAGETGYTVERSADGATFATAGNTAAGVTTFTDSGLTNYQRYFYRVRAKDAAGVSVASSIVSGVTRPGAVTSFTVSSWTESQLILNWLDRSGDAGYRIERSTDGSTFSPIAQVGANVPSYTDSSLASGTSYTYRIITLDASGDAATSNTYSTSTRIAAPPDFAFGAIASNQITLGWTNVAGETGYVIERSTDGEEFSDLIALPADTTTYTDATVTPLGEFYYRIHAMKAATPGTTSAILSAGTPSAAGLPAPWIVGDIGTTAGRGAAGADGATFTVISAGTDLDNTTDSMTYVYQPLVGDGAIIARVAAIEGTDADAEVGLMIRETLANNAKSAAVLATPESASHLRTRASTGGNSATSGSGPTGPQWLKLTRTGNTLRGYTSADGVAWTQVGSSVTIAMAETVYIGLATTSRDVELLNTSVFEQVWTGAVVLPIATTETYTVDEDSSLTTGQPLQSIVPFGATWKYLDDGSNQGTTWRNAAFADSAWTAGAAPLGYGDAGLGTTIDAVDGASNPIVTSYFRREFNVVNAAEVLRLVVDLVRDDGAAVYLNGKEIVRSNLDAAATSSTLATASIGGAGETANNHFTLNLADLPAGTLVEGRNVLAVEIHQESLTSSDVRFDLALQLERPIAPGVLANDLNLDGGATAALVSPPAHGMASLTPGGTLTYTPAGDYFGADSLEYRIVGSAAVIVPLGARWKYLDNGSNQATAWRDAAFDDSTWASGPSELGYGDNDEATTVASGPANARIPTTYFRKTIELPAGASASELSIRLKRDDAAAVYINGVQVYRDANLAAGAAYNQYAAADIPSAQENTFITIPLPAAALVAGANVLAVEIHQGGPTSSDIGFNLELSGRLQSAPVSVSVQVSPTPDLPVAVADVYEATAGQTLVAATPGILVNDTDADGDSLTTALRTNVAHGALVLASGGGFNYTPTAGFSGTDSFTYAVTDGTTASLVPAGSAWKYLDNGTNQGTAWRASEFADGGWSTGAAELGYGDGDEKSVVRCGPIAACNASNDATTYFRRTFEVADPTRLGAVTVWLLRDDAAAVYLNGQQIFRDANLAAAAAYNTFATSGADDNAVTTFAINANQLVAGTNTLAVEVHQSSATSSDLSFDLSLTATQFSATATVTINVASSAVAGDFDADDHVTLADLDLLLAALQSGGSSAFDLTGDGALDMTDLDRMVGELVETSTGVGTLYGDLDLDGDVDAHDAARFAAAFGRGGVAAWQVGDFDASGTTGVEDLARLQANLGSIASAPSPGAPAASAPSASAPSASAIVQRFAAASAPLPVTRALRATARRSATPRASIVDAAVASLVAEPAALHVRRATTARRSADGTSTTG